MQEILLAVLALGGVAAIARAILTQLFARHPGPVTISGERRAHEAREEWSRRQAERNRKRVARQADLAEWTGKFNALQLERRLRQSRQEPKPEPRGEPIAYIRAWDGTVVGTVYDDLPDYRASNAAAIEREIAAPLLPKNSDPFNLLEDLQRQRNWKP